MKKIIAVSAVLVVSAVLAAYTYSLQFRGEMDVVNSISLNSTNYRQERLTVTINTMTVPDSKEDTANTIIHHVLDNDFHTVKFSFDNGYFNELNVSVYKTKHDVESGDKLFSFTYEQSGGEIGEYDISQAEHMKLEIHE